MINEVLEKVNLHKKRAKLALEEIKNWNELDSGIFEDFEKIKTIDTFIYRFIKLQDIIGDKLFKTFLKMIGEYKDNMSLLDVLDKLEKLEIVDDAKKWMNYQKLRNELTHEYPNNENDVINGIKIAINSFNEIEKIENNIINYLSKKGLLHENRKF